MKPSTGAALQGNAVEMPVFIGVAANASANDA